MIYQNFRYNKVERLEILILSKLLKTFPFSIFRMSQKTCSKVLSPQSSGCSSKAVAEDSESDLAIGTYESDMVTQD